MDCKRLNKLGNIIIVALVLLLIFLMTYMYIHSIKNNDKNVNAQNIIVKENTQNKIETWNEKINKFQNKLQQTNKLLVLEGTTDISATLNDKKIYAKDDNLSWIKNKLASLNSKEININTTYKFGYIYDLSSIEIEKENNLNSKVIHINLLQSNIQLQYCEEDTTKTVLSSEKGIFARQFTPQEISAIMGRVHTYTYNNLINNNEIRLKAINCTKEDIIHIAEGVGIGESNIKINIIKDNLINNEDDTVENIKYKN